MNIVQAQRERALTEARHRVEAWEAVVHAWSLRLESFTGATDYINDPVAADVAEELSMVCRERGREAARQLRSAQADVTRIVANMAAAARADRVMA